MLLYQIIAGQYMKKRKYWYLSILSAFLASAPLGSLADVYFTVAGIKHNRGFIDIRIYTDSGSWLKDDNIFEHVLIPAKKGQVVVQLSSFRSGILAASVYHDENSDGKLNTGLFWRPKEGFAFSNDYKPKAMPQFSKAAIKVSDGQNVLVELNY